MKIRFLFTAEGSSDLRLQSHIENILINEGFSEVDGETPELGAFIPKVGRSVKEKLQILARHYHDVDVIFVHRDADGAGVDAREDEIMQAANTVEGTHGVIPVIPTRMLETWLLADPDALKIVAGNANGRNRLQCLPSIRNLEGIADPKGLLMDALCEASEAQGGRLSKFKKRFGEMRARLAMDLNPDGPVNDLPSYRAFRTRVSAFAQAKLNGIDKKQA